MMDKKDLANAVLPERKEINVVLHKDFHHEYFRNDRKNLQCFPYCDKFSEYKLHHEMVNRTQAAKMYCKIPFGIKIQNLKGYKASDIRVWGKVCQVTCSTTKPSQHTNAYGVKSEVSNFDTGPVDSEQYRCSNAIPFKEHSIVNLQSPLVDAYLNNVQTYSAEAIEEINSGGVGTFQFSPANWKYMEKLPKTRHEILTSSFVFQIIVGVHSSDGNASTVEILKIFHSSKFKIANTRSLTKRDSSSITGSESDATSDHGHQAKKQCLTPQPGRNGFYAMPHPFPAIPTPKLPTSVGTYVSNPPTYQLTAQNMSDPIQIQNHVVSHTEFSFRPVYQNMPQIFQIQQLSSIPTRQMIPNLFVGSSSQVIPSTTLAPAYIAADPIPYPAPASRSPTPEK